MGIHLEMTKGVLCETHVSQLTTAIFKALEPIRPIPKEVLRELSKNRGHR